MYQKAKWKIFENRRDTNFYLTLPILKQKKTPKTATVNTAFVMIPIDRKLHTKKNKTKETYVAYCKSLTRRHTPTRMEQKKKEKNVTRIQ